VKRKQMAPSRGKSVITRWNRWFKPRQNLLKMW